MLPLPTYKAVSLFSHKITAYDTVGARVNHKWQQTQEPDYTFSGKITAPKDKDLAVLPEGFVSAGVIIIHNTSKELFYVDADTTTVDPDPDVKGRQSWIRFKGDVYRVFKESNRTIDGGHRRYMAVKITRRS